MAHLDIDTVLGWRGRTVVDRDGGKIGTLGDVFLDRRTEQPAWGGVRTGLFGRRESYVPLSAVEEAGEDELRVPFEAELVKSAPRIDPDVALEPGEERALFEHYGERWEADDEPDTAPAPSGRDAAETVRSEEEVDVREGPMRPAERVRLKKVLVTEHQRRVVPVQREVVEVVEEDPPRP